MDLHVQYLDDPRDAFVEAEDCDAGTTAVRDACSGLKRRRVLRLHEVTHERCLGYETR